MTNLKYQKILQLGETCKELQGVQYLLLWDQETHMPTGGVQARAKQVALIAKLAHQARTNRALGNALQELIDLESGKFLDPGLNTRQKASLKLFRRDFLRLKKLSPSFVHSYEQLLSEATHVWAIARKENTFLRFAPYLEKIIKMNREKAERLGYEEHPYDALLEDHEPDMKASDIKPLFQKLATELPSILEQVSPSYRRGSSILHKPFEKERVVALSHQLLKAIGYDFNHGRLDFSFHPFSISMHPTDSRITTKWDDSYLKPNISSILHEAGHAFYEMGLPTDEFGSPLCEAVSLGIHESQSRFWETLIGQSLPFWRFFYPQLQKALSPSFDQVSLDEFYTEYNQVGPSLIRVDADELTYTLHIVLRFELEMALIEGSITVRDLPQVWNEKMEKYLGVRPENNAMGCMQDIHWSSGLIGYFPTYALGNLYASQLFDAFQLAHPDWDKKVQSGSFDFIRQWLHEQIYCYGRQYSPSDLIKKATGQKLNSDFYLKYLRQKYLK